MTRKRTTGYKLNNSQKDIHQFVYSDYVNVFVKNEKKRITYANYYTIYIQEIRMEFNI